MGHTPSTCLNGCPDVRSSSLDRVVLDIRSIRSQITLQIHSQKASRVSRKCKSRFGQLLRWTYRMLLKPTSPADIRAVTGYPTHSVDTGDASSPSLGRRAYPFLAGPPHHLCLHTLSVMVRRRFLTMTSDLFMSFVGFCELEEVCMVRAKS